MEKAIHREEGRVSRTTEDEFATGGFLRERVMTPSERNRRRGAGELLAKPLLRENGLRSLAFSWRKVEKMQMVNDKTSMPVFHRHTQLFLLGGV
jgi:hypothetical protein